MRVFILFVTLLISAAASAQTTIAIRGDSRSTTPPAVAGSSTWPQFMTQFDPSLSTAMVNNFSLGGIQCHQLLAGYVPTPVVPPAERFEVIKCGIADIVVAGRTPAQAYADIIALRILALADGAKPIVFAETCNRVNQAWCDELNRMIIREANHTWYGIVRADLFCRDHSDLSCFIAEDTNAQVHEAMPMAKIEAQAFVQVLNREPVSMFPKIALGCADVPSGINGKSVRCGHRVSAQNGYDLDASFDFDSGCELWIYRGASAGEISGILIAGPCGAGATIGHWP